MGVLNSRVQEPAPALAEDDEDEQEQEQEQEQEESEGAECPRWERTSPHQGPTVRLIDSHQAIQRDVAPRPRIVFACELFVYSIKRRYNASLPAVRLPIEILTTIFEFAVNKPSTDHLVDNLGNEAFGLCLLPSLRSQAHLTHVCHRWREVALGYSRLWNTIATGPADYVSSAISRARGDLEVNLLSSPRLLALEVTTLALALRHTHQIRTLAISLDCNRVGALSAFSQPAPFLQTLVLLHSSYTRQPLLEPVLFSGITPSLRRLCLRNVYFSWTSSIFRNLTTLRISTTSADYPGQLSDTIAALQQMSSLEILSLRHALPRATQEIPSSTITTLASLRHLEVQDQVDRCVELLAHLTLPNYPSLQFSLHNSRPVEVLRVDLYRFFRLINQRLHDGETTSPLCRLTLDLMGGLSGYTTRSSSTNPFLKESDRHLSLGLSSITDDNRPQWLSQFRMISTKNIRSLRFENVGDLDGPTVQALLAGTALPSVVECTISGNVSFAFLSWLLPLQHSVPSLQSLTFTGMSMNRNVCGFTIQLCLETLLASQARHRPLERLVLRNCPGLTLLMACGFEKHVGQVVWDEDMIDFGLSPR
ncbi:hypothetical protein JAAARDRAFT_199344 [Jaapia argillacea MUCL 33604]|uniref:Uncharacterized protein n=1 Tax=Jaapia argillacea MUCL 33604 TaxID=933084 RepID=A0A067PJB1_9AGAM|nr:hypothetical protein JAAARDRAFT_199344 [Jaapia argillacea MUCL 33604]